MPATRLPGVKDDLLQPTVQALPTTGGKPWRVMSQGYVAFFGGVIASTVIAFLNAGRLGAAPRQRWFVAGVGLAGLAVTIPLVVVLYDPDTSSTTKLVSRVVAVLACLAQAWLLRPLDRAFQIRDGEYGSLWKAGFAAVIGCGLAEVLLLAAAIWAFV